MVQTWRSDWLYHALRVLGEAFDELAHVLLPALVGRVVAQVRDGGLEVVGHHQVEEVAAAAPDRPVADPGGVHDGDQLRPDASVLDLVGLFGTGNQAAVQCKAGHKGAEYAG